MVVVAVELVLIGIGIIVLVIVGWLLPKTLYTVKQWEKVALLRFGRIIKNVMKKKTKKKKSKKPVVATT